MRALNSPDQIRKIELQADLLGVVLNGKFFGQFVDVEHRARLQVLYQW